MEFIINFYISVYLSFYFRSNDRKKDDDRKGTKDDAGRRDRKSDFRDKRKNFHLIITIMQFYVPGFLPDFYDHLK